MRPWQKGMTRARKRSRREEKITEKNKNRDAGLEDERFQGHTKSHTAPVALRTGGGAAGKNRGRTCSFDCLGRTLADWGE